MDGHLATKSLPWVVDLDRAPQKQDLLFPVVQSIKEHITLNLTKQ